jgi:hypothetical protein
VATAASTCSRMAAAAVGFVSPALDMSGLP